jgi:outer membrane protein OmpA-like peptidoglycan-associated protein
MMSLSISRKLALFLLVAGCMFCASCARYRQLHPVPKGMDKGRILIKSEPTKARIYIEDEYLGTTPVKTDLGYMRTHKINIKAEPIYPNQYPQNIMLEIPPVPKKMTVYMNRRVRTKAEIEAEEQKEDVAFVPPVTEKIVIQEKIVRTPVILPPIYFATDSDSIDAAQQSKIAVIYETLLEYPDFNLAIHAYADERGSVEYNKALSLKRAQAVFAALEKRGVNAERMSIMGHGERIAFSHEGLKLEYDGNRVVECRIVAGDTR